MGSGLHHSSSGTKYWLNWGLIRGRIPFLQALGLPTGKKAGALGGELLARAGASPGF